MLKKTLPVLIMSILILSFIILNIGCSNQETDAQNIVLYGIINEDAPFPQTIKDAIITIGKQSVKADEQGNYKVEGLTSGSHKIQVEALNHEVYEKTIKLSEGKNKADIPLSLTPDETMRRLLEIQKAGEYEKGYEYLHPDEKENISKDEYIAKMKKNYEEQGVKIIDFEIKPAKMLDKWTDPESKRVYPNTAEMETSILVEIKKPNKSERYQIDWNTHLVKVGNQWRGFS